MAAKKKTELVTVYHPTIAGVTQETADAAAWTEQGWLETEPTYDEPTE